ncbi:MAG TPA: hypothetical protein VKR58_03795 [Aquella sp.]|nr:hypothetical protein [Aquella sp.]
MDTIRAIIDERAFGCSVIQHKKCIMIDMAITITNKNKFGFADLHDTRWSQIPQSTRITIKHINCIVSTKDEIVEFLLKDHFKNNISIVYVDSRINF